ncbi:hypothetical protein CC1G_08041 [Coprinopsis cinerea okayama7|uniref:SnoaL-like domain-containing protein n=1 Tax=Coprinopsis cinerea (strain Okayama-7 / 130 / ATCC MYA-4618 / FGSC 9003) TaxID=240176 RepID=A8NQD5_COPC7|nr:hypothetical protein CC1G_08041 [Coprinopsis cinerea okayama7\|eukprot:XP_001835532.2 hypothetical protein CC1G_08041 [Coprinopsis cinerea okayama7\
MAAALPSLEEQLLSATNAFLKALACNLSPLRLLSFFSSSSPVTLQHAQARCPHAQTSRFTGLNAVRSYFDLLTAHWTRSAMQIHSRPWLDVQKRRIVIDASVTWMWRSSGRTWTEDFICTIDYDDAFKIVSFVVETESPPETCIMTAKDIPSVSAASFPAIRPSSPLAPSPRRSYFSELHRI